MWCLTLKSSVVHFTIMRSRTCPLTVRYFYLIIINSKTNNTKIRL